MEIALSSFLSQVPAFVEALVEEARNLGLDLSSYEMDHFCLRVENTSQYERYKKEAAQLGTLMSEALVNGRPIASYKLHQEIVVGPKKIGWIEIPSPKKDAAYPLGLEHVECVINEDLELFVQRFPFLKFDTRAIKKTTNPEITLKLPSGNAIKFHRQSLEQVIALEQKLGTVLP